MQVDKPLVSIGIASYNNSKYIIDTLQSINNQTYDNIEIIIIDDFSTDNSVELVEKWSPESKFPVKFIRNKENKGVTKVCNIILKSISPSSKYLCLIGSDDIMLPYRVAMQVSLLESSTGNNVATFSDMYVINDVGNIINASYYHFNGENFDSIISWIQLNRESLLECLIHKNIIPTPSVMYRTDIIKSVGGWDEDLSFEDWDMYLRLTENGFSFLPTNDKLIKYRKHDQSITRKPDAVYFESLLKLVTKYRGISKSIDNAINIKIKQLAVTIYEKRGKNSVKWLVNKFKITKDFKTAVYIVCAFLRIPFVVLQKIKHPFEKTGIVKNIFL